jgi:hypothetical protein
MTAMIAKRLAGAAVAGALLGAFLVSIGIAAAQTELVTNGPQGSPADAASSARQNVKQSQNYDAMLSANPGFRAQRIQKECGPITDPRLHSECVASFGPNEGAPARRKH